MKFTLEIQCDNAAFENDPAKEVARILREVAKQVGAYPAFPSVCKARDLNGNTVGTYGFSDD
jgi:hypothetical protein